MVAHVVPNATAAGTVRAPVMVNPNNPVLSMSSQGQQHALPVVYNYAGGVSAVGNNMVPVNYASAPPAMNNIGNSSGPQMVTSGNANLMVAPNNNHQNTGTLGSNMNGMGNIPQSGSAPFAPQTEMEVLPSYASVQVMQPPPDDFSDEGSAQGHVTHM